MKIYTIPRKMSNTGSIHDIESDQCERDIKFPKGFEYAVVLAAYYGGKGYTVHKTLEAAEKQSTRDKAKSHVVIDSDGNRIY